MVPKAVYSGVGLPWAGRGSLTRWPLRRYAVNLAALVLAYYAAAHLGYALRFSGPVAAVVWLPVGVGVAFLYLRGVRYWPGIVIGDLLVNNYSALPVGSAVAQTCGNLLEVLVAVWLLQRLCPRDEPIGTLGGVAGLVAAIACGTILSATIGSVASWVGGVIHAHSLPYVWRTWMLGDFSGALIVVPLALAWSTLPPRPWQRVRVLEGVLVLATVAGLSTIQLGATAMLCVLVFPALIWAALRLGLWGASLAITITCAFAVLAAVNGEGPFSVGSTGSGLLDNQLFIATVSLSALAIAALVSERARLAAGVSASRARLVATSDEARRSVERDLHDGAQQDLLGLQLKLEQTEEAIATDPEEAKRLVHVVVRQMDDVLESLRSIASGVYPALLRERGIVDALRAAARRSASPVAILPAAVTRYDPAVEAAVYFCCLEAIQNISKHAGPRAAGAVRLWQEPNALRFDITDSGFGFDEDPLRDGHGLANMRDRIEAAGGTLTVTSRVGSGTAIGGRVPF